MNRPRTQLALRITALYLVVTGLWIVLTDRGLSALTDDPARLSGLQTFKGLLFIITTALLLFLLLRYTVRVQQRSYDQALRHANELEQRVRERTAELHRAINRVEAILNSSTDLIVLAHPTGMIDQVNPTASQTLGYDSDNLFGRPLTALVAHESMAAFEKALNRVIRTGQPQRIETVVQRRDGEPFVADAVLSPVVDHGDESGAVTGVVCALRDITRRKRLEGQLRHLLRREMALGELKTRLISVASHELRTPLTVIQMSADLLARSGESLSDESQRRRLARIQTSVRQATGLLDDLLTVSRIETGAFKAQPEPLDLEALCAGMLAEYEGTIAREHTLTFHCVGDCRQVIMDARLLRHILGNLLSNAIKYSPTGSTVTLEVIREGEQVVLKVQDEGIGIPELDRAHLFEPFHRASNVGTEPGTGLGLTIVKEAVELQSGTIAVESQANTGTTFIVALPAVMAMRD